MSKTGTKEDFVDHLVYRCGLQRASALRAVEGMIERMSQLLCDGHTIRLKGFAYIHTVDRQERSHEGAECVSRPAIRQARISLCHKMMQRLNPNLSTNKNVETNGTMD